MVGHKSEPWCPPLKAYPDAIRVKAKGLIHHTAGLFMGGIG
jgi:hypothetical protein